MKKFYLLGILCILNTFSVFSQTTVIDSMLFAGIQRTFRIYIPKINDGSKPVPLVFNLHGLGSNAMEQEIYGDFRTIADTANFIIVAANGTPTIFGQSWNNFSNPGTGVDDVGFISALIDKVSARYQINKNRIYSTGMSNGGFMSYDLACFLNTRIAAIASVTGSMIASHLSACKVTRPTPVMEIHGTADNTVSYNGNGGIINSTNIDTLVNFWAKLNNCSAPVVTTLPNTNTNDNSTVEHVVFNNGRNGTTVELYKVINGGHSWPGSAINIPGQVTNKDFNASREIWRFFNQFSLDKITSVDQPSAAADFQLFPNPASTGFEIRIPGNQNYSIRLLNSVGQEMFQTKSGNGGVIIERGHLAAGVYLVQISSAENNVFKRIVFN